MHKVRITMIKKSAILISAALILSVFLTGCNNSNSNSNSNNSSTEQVSSESTDQFTEDYIYGTYVDDLDFYLNRYINYRKNMQNAFSESDKVLATGYANDSIGSLNKVKAIEVPTGLEEKHEKLLGAVDIEIRIMECNKELVEFIGKMDSLTPDEQSAMDALNKKANDILKESEEYGGFKKYWIEVRKEACTHLSKGEYNTYNFNLDIYWDVYTDNFVKVFNIFFNGEQGDVLKYIENCEEVFSNIENMDVPESMESYHKDIVDAIPSEKEFIDLIKEYETIRREHPGVEFDNLPEDVKKKITDIEEKINTFFETDEKPSVMVDAMIAAGKYAEEQLK
jgi:hypothetical protein